MHNEGRELKSEAPQLSKNNPLNANLTDFFLDVVS
jgi:hypothetical protein